MTERQRNGNGKQKRRIKRDIEGNRDKDRYK